MDHNFPPESNNCLRLQMSQPFQHQASNFSEWSKELDYWMRTYFFPVLRFSGLIFTDLKWANASSIGLVVKEYGAVMQTLRPKACIYFCDSSLVWYFAPSMSTIVFFLQSLSSFVKTATSFEMKRQNTLVSVFTYVKAQYSFPDVHIAINIDRRGSTGLLLRELVKPRFFQHLRSKFESLIQD